jgi:hypothetical protein
MNAEQDALYDELEKRLNEATKEDLQRDQLKIMGQMARIALHPALKDYSDDDSEEESVDKDEAKKRKAAAKKARSAILRVADPHCPKIDACAKYVLNMHTAKEGCGFIIFCEQIIVQEWMRQVLVEFGMKDKKIAILNAETAGGLQGRMDIADQFNGDQYTTPIYDVVIANQIAYEGIDLQRRTCMVADLDLPWSPSTLQQRHGRGVRQGNTQEVVDIKIFFSDRSMDAYKWRHLQGKRSWMVKLIKGLDTSLNNPGGDMKLDPIEALIEFSRNPEGLRELLNKRIEDSTKKQTEETIRWVKEKMGQADAAFSGMRRGWEVEANRKNGEEVMKMLAKVNADIWPWYERFTKVRTHNMIVFPKGECLYSGQRVMMPTEHRSIALEIGRAYGSTVMSIREVKSPKWIDQSKSKTTESEAKWIGQIAKEWTLASTEGEKLPVGYPDNDDEQVVEVIKYWATKSSIYSSAEATHAFFIERFQWYLAPESFVNRLWPKVAEYVHQGMNIFAQGNYSQHHDHHFPILNHTIQESAVWGNKQGVIPDGWTLPVPNQEGWGLFLAWGKRMTDEKGVIEKAVKDWWGWDLPMGWETETMKARRLAKEAERERIAKERLAKRAAAAAKRAKGAAEVDEDEDVDEGEGGE